MAEPMAEPMAGVVLPLDPATAVVTSTGGLVDTVSRWGPGNAGQQRAQVNAPRMAAWDGTTAQFQVAFTGATFAGGRIATHETGERAHPEGALTLGIVQQLGHGCYKSVFEVCAFARGPQHSLSHRSRIPASAACATMQHYGVNLLELTAPCCLPIAGTRHEGGCPNPGCWPLCPRDMQASGAHNTHVLLAIFLLAAALCDQWSVRAAASMTAQSGCRRRETDPAGLETREVTRPPSLSTHTQTYM